MNPVIQFLFEQLLNTLEYAASKTETKLDDKLVEMIRAAYETYKKGDNK